MSTKIEDLQEALIREWKAINEEWSAAQKKDILRRYDYAVRLKQFFEIPGAPSRFAFDQSLGYKVVSPSGNYHSSLSAILVRIAKRFSRGDVVQLAANGYGWSDLKAFVSGAEVRLRPEVRRALEGDDRGTVLAVIWAKTHGQHAPSKSDARRVEDKKHYDTRDANSRLLAALADLTPEQIVNRLDRYVSERCVEARGNAIRRGLLKRWRRCEVVS